MTDQVNSQLRSHQVLGRSLHEWTRGIRILQKAQVHPHLSARLTPPMFTGDLDIDSLLLPTYNMAARSRESRQNIVFGAMTFGQKGE